MKLIKDFEQKISQTAAIVEDLPWDKKEFYSEWLAQTFHFVRHTTSFLALTAAKFGPDARKDQYHALEHLREEKNHDQLLLNDLKKIGGNIKDHPAFIETRLFFQSQYYYIESHSPHSHMGYSLFLEGLAAKICPPLYKRIEKTYGLGSAAFIKTHGLVDDEHFAEGAEMLKTLSARDLELIAENLEQTHHLYCAILQKADTHSVKARAA
jgi:hypothetical protein